MCLSCVGGTRYSIKEVCKDTHRATIKSDLWEAALGWNRAVSRHSLRLIFWNSLAAIPVWDHWQNPLVGRLNVYFETQTDHLRERQEHRVCSGQSPKQEERIGLSQLSNDSKPLISNISIFFATLYETDLLVYPEKKLCTRQVEMKGEFAANEGSDYQFDSRQVAVSTIVRLFTVSRVEVSNISFENFCCMSWKQFQSRICQHIKPTFIQPMVKHVLDAEFWQMMQNENELLQMPSCCDSILILTNMQSCLRFASLQIQNAYLKGSRKCSKLAFASNSDCSLSYQTHCKRWKMC